MTEARRTFRYLTADGRKNVPAVAAAIEARADFISNPDRYGRSLWADEFSTFTRMDWLRIAAQEITAEYDGELQRYEMILLTRAAGLPTVSDQVHGKRASDITMIAAE